MNKTVLLLAFGLAVSSAFARDDTERERAPYFQTLTAKSPQLAAYSFVIAQFLDMKCGRQQSLGHLKSILDHDDSSPAPVILALKAGDTEEAQTIIHRLPCEQATVPSRGW